MSKQLSVEILHKHCSHLFYKDDPDLLFVYKAMQEYADTQLTAAQERIKQLEDALVDILRNSNSQSPLLRIIHDRANEALTPNNQNKEDE